MSDPTPLCDTKFAMFSGGHRSAIRLLVPILWASLTLSCVCAEIAFGADAPAPSSPEAAVREVVLVANEFIEHGPCEASRADPSVVATLSPYTTDVAAGHTAAEYAVLWGGDINCSGGSGTNTMNFLLVEKSGVAAARIVGVGEIVGAQNVQRIVSTTPDSLTVEVYTWGPDDLACCATVYESWILRREPGVKKGRYILKRVNSKPATPVPLSPGEKKLPTARSQR
jgi:hypothetical protein